MLHHKIPYPSVIKLGQTFQWGPTIQYHSKQPASASAAAFPAVKLGIHSKWYIHFYKMMTTIYGYLGPTSDLEMDTEQNCKKDS